jgi:ATP-binding cassette subfamily B protein
MAAEKKKRFPTRLSLLMYFLKGAKRFFVGAVIGAVLIQILALVNPKIIRYTVDSIIGSDPSSLPDWANRLVDRIGGIPYIREHLWVIALAVILVALLRAAVNFLYRVSNSAGAEKLVKRMRDELFRHIEHLPYAWFSENKTGDIIQRCTSDVETIKMFVSEQLTVLLRIVIMVFLALYYMFGIHVKLTLMACIFLPVIVIYSFFFHHSIGDAFRKADEEEGKLSAIAQENLTGVRVVRAFNQEQYERNRFAKQNQSYTDMWVRMMKLMSRFWTSVDFISGIETLIITAMGAYFTVHGQMTAGSFIAYLSYNQLLLWPVRMMGRVIAQMSKAGISIDRLAYIMNAEEEQDDPDAVDVKLEGDIVFDHVRFAYPNNTDGTLRDVSFTIPAGSTLGIIGATGSGKSTMMYLLDRLQELKEGDGTITIGGIDIRKIKRECLRSQIGMVLQEPYLFSRTLEENIRIARPGAKKEDIREASRIASLDETIQHFQKGYNTYVGERGVTLSGGQKQRAAIAQMLIRKPPIMIFDDSLSAVDAETDAHIRQALQANTAGSTVILIAHRLTTLMKADQIIVLDQGRIAEHGTHEELMKQNGIYKQIYDLQIREE